MSIEATYKFSSKLKGKQRIEKEVREIKFKDAEIRNNLIFLKSRKKALNTSHKYIPKRENADGHKAMWKIVYLHFQKDICGFFE